MTTPQAHELPELPVPNRYREPGDPHDTFEFYTSDQLHAYGQSCIESALQSASVEGAVAWNERVLPSLRNRLMMRLRVHGMGETESAKVANEEVDFVETVLSAYFGKWPAKPEAQSGDWVMVPREPTIEMAQVFRADNGASTALTHTRIQCEDFASRYKIMLTAAPQPPAASVEDVEAQARDIYDTALRAHGLHEEAYHVGCGAELDNEQQAVIDAITAALRTRSVGVEGIIDGEFGDDGNLTNRVPWRVFRDDEGALWLTTDNPERDIEIELPADTARTVIRGESNG